ncbi:hypothetical protein [Thiorhodovibrio frisius]|uniref:Uncharacterized protein n=1 Tax=Thiorhodovibrio frisius TaxID=631362 RepID=H8Z7A9_9GAMM|nr:hypothetical protein [Thiorhodovibrio frisius]EIC19825.1 hypothetical protein Thi970DRAFT_03429 [Thiorhodovibrio frisius]WPL20553.1 hypothetical protein Thiofri_00652 [Thiorhodovibrio frisius]
MPPSLPKSVLALFVVPLVTATLSISTPTQAAETLVADGKVVTYERLRDTDTPAVGFQMDSNGYRNIYLLDCENRRFLWVKNIDLRTGRETERPKSAEWKSMNARSTVTNAVYQASCPGSRTTDSEFNFNRTQGTQGAWGWNGPAAITSFSTLGIKLGVTFLPGRSCDEALFFVEAKQKLPSLGFQIDGQEFGYVEPEFLEIDEGFSSIFALSKNGLAALKRGYQLRLESSLGVLNVSLQGSAASFNNAYNNCLASYQNEQTMSSGTEISLQEALQPLEAMWGLDSSEGCLDTDWKYRVFIGRHKWTDQGGMYIDKEKPPQLSFYEGYCEFGTARQQGNRINLESHCQQEEIEFDGITVIEIVNPNLINIQIPDWRGESTLHRCPDYAEIPQ